MPWRVFPTPHPCFCVSQSPISCFGEMGSFSSILDVVDRTILCFFETIFVLNLFSDSRWIHLESTWNQLESAFHLDPTGSAWNQWGTVKYWKRPDWTHVGLDQCKTEVFAVPRRFRLELVGTSWIPIRNFWSQYRPNSRKFLQFFQPDSDWNQWNRSVLPVLSPINSDQYRVEPIRTGWKEPHQCIYSRRSPDDILSRGK